MGKKRAHQPGYTQKIGRNGKKYWARNQPSLNPVKPKRTLEQKLYLAGEQKKEQKLNPNTCYVLKGNRQLCGKPSKENIYKCGIHVNKNIWEPSTNLRYSSYSLDEYEAGFIGGGSLVNPSPIKYNYDSYCQDLCRDESGDFYNYCCRCSVIENIRVESYSASRHAALLLNDVPEPFITEHMKLAAHIYTDAFFNVSDFEGDSEQGYYGEEFCLNGPSVDVDDMYWLMSSSSEELLQFMFDSINIRDVKKSWFETFPISEIAEKLIGDNSDRVDVDVNVPLAVCRKKEEGYDVIWGKENLENMVFAYENDTNSNSSYIQNNMVETFTMLIVE